MAGEFKTRAMPPVEWLRERYRVDAESRIERRRKSGGWALASKFRGGKYSTVCIAGENYLTHRVIWKLCHGTEPGMLDHINGCPWDNRIENLREVTYTENRWNTKPRANATGYPNVKRHRSAGFYAEVVARGQRYASPFFDDAELAGLVAQEMKRRHHGEYTREAA